MVTHGSLRGTAAPSVSILTVALGMATIAVLRAVARRKAAVVMSRITIGPVATKLAITMFVGKEVKIVVDIGQSRTIPCGNAETSPSAGRRNTW